VIRQAWRALWERRVRTAIAVIGVTICVLALTTVDGMSGYTRYERAQDAARFVDSLLLQPAGAGYPPFRGMLRLSSVASVLDRPDIVPGDSTPILLLVLAPSDNPMDIAGVIGLGVWPGREGVWLDSVEAASGRSTLAGQGDDAVILGSGAARHYGVSSAGETITIAARRWRVAGVLEETGFIRMDGLVVMPLETSQAAFGLEDWISAVLLTTPGGGIPELAVSLTAVYPGLEVFTPTRIRASLQREVSLPNNFLGALTWIAFMIAVLIMAGIMSMAVRERAGDIERIRGLGDNRFAILGYTMIETLSLGVAGGILGAAASVPLAYVLGWKWILSWGAMARVEILVVLAGILAGAYPAFRAARAYPQALRYDELRRRMEEVAAEKRLVDQAYHHQVRGREEERERLARELHDQAIQGLVGLKFHAAENVQPMINDIIESLRRVCSDLRPPALERLGLAATLRSYVGDFSLRTGLSIDLRLVGEERRLPQDVELSLFRVAQEALINAWKHAQAPGAEVRLCFDSLGAGLTVSDRGRGFGVPQRLEEMAKAGHFGLVGMRERMLLAGGSLEVESKPGEGTTVAARIPAAGL
jgi:putative ABC transport system permease protein